MSTEPVLNVVQTKGSKRKAVHLEGMRVAQLQKSLAVAGYAALPQETAAAVPKAQDSSNTFNIFKTPVRDFHGNPSRCSGQFTRKVKGKFVRFLQIYWEGAVVPSVEPAGKLKADLDIVDIGWFARLVPPTTPTIPDPDVQITIKADGKPSIALGAAYHLLDGIANSVWKDVLRNVTAAMRHGTKGKLVPLVSVDLGKPHPSILEALFCTPGWTTIVKAYESVVPTYNADDELENRLRSALVQFSILSLEDAFTALPRECVYNASSFVEGKSSLMAVVAELTASFGPGSNGWLSLEGTSLPRVAISTELQAVASGLVQFESAPMIAASTNARQQKLIVLRRVDIKGEKFVLCLLPGSEDEEDPGLMATHAKHKIATDLTVYGTLCTLPENRTRMIHVPNVRYKRRQCIDTKEFFLTPVSMRWVVLDVVQASAVALL